MKKTNILLTALGLAILLLLSLFLVRGCQEEVELPWGPWEILSQNLQKSPDHLPAQWEKILESGDARLVFEFVRDRIQTIPPILTGAGGQKYRWKSPGTLRTGQGTSLEKAVLLSEGLKALGFTPELFTGRWDANNWDSLYAWVSPTPFELEGLEALREVHRNHQLTTWSQVQSAYPLPNLAKWSEDIHTFLGDRHPIKTPDWKQGARDLYGIKVEIDSQEIYLNPSFPDARWGESYVRNKPVPYSVKPRHIGTQLSIKLKASYDDRSYSPFTLAEANWPLEEVMGKDIQLGFKVLGPPEILLNTPVEKFESFVSTIELLDPLGPLPDSFRISGDVITTRGKVIPKDRARKILDEELDLTRGDASKARLVSIKPPKIADFPTVLLEVEVEDEEGEALMDLSEEDFNILVNGEQVTHRMVVNRKLPPRVLFLYDDSGSMPQEYGSRTRTIEIFQQIAQACQQINPDTEFAVSPFGDRETKIYKLSDWSNNVSALSRYISRTRSGNSHNWSALLGATNIKEANMAILLTDADGTQRASDYADQRYKEGMPGLIYAVLDSYSNKDEFQKMATKTSGIAFRIEEQMAEAITDIQARIGETKNERYLIEVEVENEEIPFMDLQVQVGPDGLFGELKGLEVPLASYERPGGKNAITGIYVEVSYLNRKFTYKIAGVPVGASPNQYPVTQELIDECNNALWGTYILHVEGSSPIPAVALDEKCQHYLQLKPLVSLLDETDPDIFFQSLQELYWIPDYPAKWPLILGNRDSLFENALSCWMYAEYPDPQGQYWQRVTPLATSQKLAPLQASETGESLQMEEGLMQTSLMGKNMNQGWVGLSPLFPLQSYRLSPNGLFSQYFLRSHPHTGPLLSSFPGNTVDQPRNFITRDSMKADWGFLIENNSTNLIPIGIQGSIGERKMAIQLDKKGRLVDHPHLWRKTLGMKMDTWMDLEGDKLAFIQVGTVGIQGLGQQIDSETLMNQIKKKIQAYILSEKTQSIEYFGDVPEAWLDGYNIARNNLSTLFLPRK